MFLERTRPRRIAAFAAACVAAVVSFGFAGNALAAAVPPVLQGLPFSIVGSGDFDGNGRADIVWHNADTNETQIWFMNGHVLQHKQTVLGENGQPVFVGLPWSIVGVGDLNNNGRDDIVWHNANTNETQVWFMNGNRIVQRSTVLNENGQPIFVGLPWSIVGVGDLNNNNGRDDIVWHNANTNETQVWFMNGNQIVQRSTVLNENGQPVFVGLPWSIGAVGDLDGAGLDGNRRADIVWHNASTNETQVWFMNGNQIVQRSTVLNENGQPIFVGPPWSIVGVGDLDGNVKADIVWHDANTNETQVWFMNGNRIVQRATVISAVN